MNRTEQFTRPLQTVANYNTDGLASFFSSEPSRPLLATASGGEFPAARFASLLYNAAFGFARAESPYTLNSVSDRTLRQGKLLIVSSSGHNQDADYIAARATSLIPQHTALLCNKLGDRNTAAAKINKVADKGVHCFATSEELSPKGFVACSILSQAILYKSFVGQLRPTDFDTEATFSYQLNKSQEVAPALSSFSHFVVLHGSWGEPAAVDFETRMVESGMASVQLSDYRNFCHGRFLFVSNHLGKKGCPADTAVVLFVTPRERNVADRLLVLLPEGTPVILIESKKDSPASTIELTMQGIRLFDSIGEAQGINPANPTSKGGIDKRDPQNRILFKTDFKEFGALSLYTQA